MSERVGEQRIGMVVFDLGGVIVRICRSWAEGCAAAGIGVRGEVMAEELVRRRRELSRAYQVGAIGCDEFFAGISRAMNGVYTPEEVRRVHEAWLIGEYAGVRGLIDDLHAAGVETGVLSNTNHAHWEAMGARRGPDGERMFGAVWKPRCVQASHLMRLAKPDVEIHRAYERAAGWGEDVKRRRGEILFFDDLEENIAGAQAAGWRAERVDHTGDTAGQMREVLRGYGVV